jgi:hypothetical protein
MSDWPMKWATSGIAARIATYLINRSPSVSRSRAITFHSAWGVSRIAFTRLRSFIR